MAGDNELKISKLLKLNFFVFSLVFSTLFLSICNAELTNYISKYRDVTISQTDLQKITKYEDLIKYFCNFSYFKPHHKVSPDFIKALILAESRGNPQAISSKNALGLGQIIFSTGKQAAVEIARSQQLFDHVHQEKLWNLKKEDLFDPAINILLTCYLISKYNFRYGGKLDLVVSAWNAGENTKSLKEGKPSPNHETYNLIGKVNGYYHYLIGRGENS